MGYYGGWKPYVSVAQRQRNAQREMEKLKKKGKKVEPVILEGRAIASTFWGEAWCDNLESYSDYSNRLPRGRSYVKNGSVVDLQVARGEVEALVSGSEIYKVQVSVAAVPAARWQAICEDCAQGIDSLIDLLQGRFSKGVMERLCRQGTGLFPSPKEIEFECDCPDGASMCKHVAAVLYGVGARLDHKPELLFQLRNVDGNDLLASAGKGLPLSKNETSSKKVLGGAGLSDLFDIEMAQEPAGKPVAAKPKPAKQAVKTAPAQTAAAPKTQAKAAVGKAAVKAAEKAPAKAAVAPKKPVKAEAGKAAVKAAAKAPAQTAVAQKTPAKTALKPSAQAASKAAPKTPAKTALKPSAQAASKAAPGTPVKTPGASGAQADAFTHFLKLTLENLARLEAGLQPPKAASTQAVGKAGGGASRRGSKA